MRGPSKVVQIHPPSAPANAELRREIEDSPGLPEFVAAEARKAYLHARGLEPVPWRVLDGRWNEYQRAVYSARTLPDFEPPGSPREWTSRITCLREARAALAYFQAFTTTHEPLAHAGRLGAVARAEFEHQYPHPPSAA